MSETKLNFNECILKVQLKAQSPHIHFQSNETGATLRGSELKPKLDAFLKKKMGKEDDTSLDYKIKLECKMPTKTVPVGVNESRKNNIQESYPIFYGNTGRDVKLRGVWSDPELTIICFENKIKRVIEAELINFFCVTNFGTMQDKGFGSYIVDGTEQMDETIINKWLTEAFDTKYCWSCSYKSNTVDKNSRCNKQSGWIKSFYGIMKSGQNFGGYIRSYLFEYMHKNHEKASDTSNIIKNIDNEKAWMKQNEIAPKYSKDGRNDNKHDIVDENPRYVRAFLGMSGAQTWKKDDFRGKESISISDPKKKIERIASPIFFKIIGNKIFFIAEKVPDELYNYEFEFKGMRTDRLKTPSKEQFKGGKFDIEKFVSSYVTYFNQAIEDKVAVKRDFGTIKEWRCSP